MLTVSVQLPFLSLNYTKVRPRIVCAASPFTTTRRDRQVCGQRAESGRRTGVVRVSSLRYKLSTTERENCGRFQHVNTQPLWNQCTEAASFMPDGPSLLLLPTTHRTYIKHRNALSQRGTRACPAQLTRLRCLCYPVRRHRRTNEFQRTRQHYIRGPHIQGFIQTVFWGGNPPRKNVNPPPEMW